LRLGYVGRLDPDKRPLDLPPLCDELERRGVPYHLTIVGGGSQRGSLLEAMAARVARGFVAVRDAMPVQQLYESVYPTLDCALLCSPSEGFPLMVIEAMLHGVIPVVSDYRGRAAEGVVRDGETGLVFPIGDLRAAAAALERLHQESASVERLAGNARAAAEAGGYTIDQHARRWADLLDDVICRPPAAMVASKVPRAAGWLDKVLGFDMAEHTRRILRRRFPHPDLSEWPHTQSWPPEVLTPVEAEILAVQRELN
jgi:glycosyltransferase involved in cell wall biosynthesis